MYDKVKTWADMCATNVDFLQGKYEETFYHGGSICEESSVLLDDLIQLNSLGFFTNGSQPGLNHEILKQKSYVQFSCKQYVAYKLLPILLKEDNIFFSFQAKYGRKPFYIDTFPEERYNLTKDIHKKEWVLCTNWNRSAYIFDGTIEEPILCQCARSNTRLYNFFVNKVHIFLACKEYDETFSAPRKVLEIIENIK